MPNLPVVIEIRKLNSEQRYSEALNLEEGHLLSNPDDASVLAEKLISLYGIGEKRSAKKILETALKKEPSQNDFLFVRGYFSSLEGNLDAAIRDYTEAIRIDPAFARAFNNRGIAFKTKDALDEAIRDFNEATRIDPTYADAFYNRGNTYQAKADWDTAIRDYTEAIRINPNHKLAKNNLKEVNKLKKNK